MDHLALVFGYIGRIYAMRRAVEYDLRDLPFPQECDARLWRALMACWKAAHS